MRNMTILKEISKADQHLFAGSKQGKVLLFFTSLLKADWGDSDHISQFRHVWPLAMKRNEILRNADVLVHAGAHFDEVNHVRGWSKGQAWVNVSATPPELYYELYSALRSLPNRNVTIRYMHNPGYHTGAVKTMIDGLEGGWFDAYDWVIRLNPDVMIYDETRLARAMLNTSIYAVLSNCGLVDDGNHITIMSDFFAFRPSMVNYKKWNRNWQAVHAESWATHAFDYLVKEGHSYWVQRYSLTPTCRTSQPDVLHGHFNWEDQIYKFYNASYEIITRKP
jgi:hypothetical protein